MNRYSVQVGNVGETYCGANWKLARAEFVSWVGVSKGGAGRAAGEPVTLFKNGEPFREYEPAPAKFKTRTYRIWTYDVWGNADDGFNVNDRYKHGTVQIRCKRRVFNAGGPHAFATYDPTDLQLSRAANVHGANWTGGEGVYYAERKSDGKPLGELEEEKGDQS